MQRPCLWVAFALVGLFAGPAAAQPPGTAVQLPGTAVQLPTFSQFGVGTTLSVPDRGSGFMGGINRSASGRNSFGSPLLPFRPFRNNAIGSEQSAMGMHVSAWIHDFDAMDEYLLGQPPRTVGSGPVQGNFAAGLSRGGPASLDPAWNVAGAGRGTHVVAAPPGGQWESAPQATPAAPLLDVDAEQRRREVQAENRSSEAHAFFLRGQEAEASGKANVARIYYQMAARRAAGELQNQVLAKLRGIAQAETAGALAHSAD